MTPEERRRAGRAIDERMRELGMTPPSLARKARLSPNTIRSLIHGRTWPRAPSRMRLNAALGWTEGEIYRQATAPPDMRLQQFTTAELLEELTNRLRHLEAAQSSVRAQLR